MSKNQTFQRSLGPNLGDAIQICQVTSSTGAAEGGTSRVGIRLSIVQTSGLDRNYRVSVSPTELTGRGVWKRLTPIDKTEKFLNQNHWAVDLSNEISEESHTITVRLVRTKVGVPPSATVLKCKVIAYPSVGQSVLIEDVQETSNNVTTSGIYDGALISQVDGLVGINTDAPLHELDVLGNTNTSGTFRIMGTDVLSTTSLGTSVVTSALSTVGNLQRCRGRERRLDGAPDHRGYGQRGVH